MAYKSRMMKKDRRSTDKHRPVVLCILDGWGHRVDVDHNAVAQAKTPTWDRLMARYPHALLDASEHEVGLPEGQMGNSEVGHMNLGAGRVVLQDLPRIDDAIDRHVIPDLPAFRSFVDAMKTSGGTAHVMGLLSPGGVHAHQRHIASLARYLSNSGISVAIHALLDGRDTPPQSALDYLAAFEQDIAGLDNVRVATVTGRFYAMDRDQRWDRVSLAYAGIVTAAGETSVSALAAIRAGYDRDETDEFIRPTIVGDYAGMTDGDGILMANFRADRAREILTALLDPSFNDFERDRRIEFAGALGMVDYSEHLSGFLSTLFPAQELHATLGETVAAAGLRQLRIAETEKYAHVTFFLNGGEEKEFAGEERILVPSPKVATYDLQPEMSAPEVTDKLVDAIESGRFDLIVVNFANTDMVGHTGNLAAAIEAVEAVDGCLARIDRALADVGGAMIVTADHGNAELMRDAATGQPHTAHTMNLVPAILCGTGLETASLQNGRLADVAPTLLDLMGLETPSEMTGRNLVTYAGVPTGIDQLSAAE